MPTNLPLNKLWINLAVRTYAEAQFNCAATLIRVEQTVLEALSNCFYYTIFRFSKLMFLYLFGVTPIRLIKSSKRIAQSIRKHRGWSTQLNTFSSWCR
jgi:hypothetical protein